MLREDVRCTHQPRGNFPPLTQLRQGRQADVIWKQKNKISGERKTPEAHQGRERPQAKGAWELLKKKMLGKGSKKSPWRSWHLLGRSLRKDGPVGSRGRGVESDLGRGGGAERPGVTKEGTLTQTTRMTTACRLVPTLRMAALRVAASGSPPSPLRPQGRHRLAPNRRGRAESPWIRQVPPRPYRVQGSVGIYHSAGLGCLHLYLHRIFCAFRSELFLQVLEKKGHCPYPVVRPQASTVGNPSPSLQ